MRSVFIMGLVMISTAVCAAEIERVSHPTYGFGQREPTTGITWFDEIHQALSFGGTLEGAWRKCLDLGLELPTKEDFESANFYGIGSVNRAPGKWWESRSFWTSTPIIGFNAHSHYYIYQTSSGDVSGVLPTRADLPNGFFPVGAEVPNGSVDAICIKR